MTSGQQSLNCPNFSLGQFFSFGTIFFKSGELECYHQESTGYIGLGGS